jgi:hypothetical protein
LAKPAPKHKRSAAAIAATANTMTDVKLNYATDQVLYTQLPLYMKRVAENHLADLQTST